MHKKRSERRRRRERKIFFKLRTNEQNINRIVREGKILLGGNFSYTSLSLSFVFSHSCRLYLFCVCDLIFEEKRGTKKSYVFSLSPTAVSANENQRYFGCVIMNKRKLIMESNKHMYSYIEIVPSKNFSIIYVIAHM